MTFSLAHLNDQTVSAINDAEIAGEPIDRAVEIEALAALDSIEYEAGRTKAAKRLGVRATVLDREVTKTRKQLGLASSQAEPGQGIPWRRPIRH